MDNNVDSNSFQNNNLKEGAANTPDVSTTQPEQQNIQQPSTQEPSLVQEPSKSNYTNQLIAKDGKHKTKKKLIFGIVILVVIILVVVGFFIFLKQQPVSTSSMTGNSQDFKDQKSNSITKTLQNVVFNDNIQEIGYQPVFTDEALKKYGYPEDVATKNVRGNLKFYKVGTVNGNEDLILARMLSVDPSGVGYILIKKQDKSYTLLTKHSSLVDESLTYNGPEYEGNTKLDSETIIPVLEVKNTIAYNGVNASLAPYSRPQFLDTDKDTKQTEVAKIEQGTVYEQIYDNPHHPGVKQFSIVLKQPTGMYLVYRYTTDILKDDNSVAITYKDGKTSTEKYNWAMIRAGCGVVDSVNVVDKKYFNDLTEIGKAGSEPIYGFKSSNHQVVTTLYQNYNMDGSREGAVSQEQFWKDNGVVVVKNKLGYRVILVNDKYQAQGECGKPVIYLYPQQKTDLTVRVGADVTVSDPEYGDGWDVTANPNGQIYNKKDGKTYPYLFWEGQGHGVYPKITEGLIVKHSEVEATLWDHLTKLGLNQQESKDFMEFWLPKMPNTPFVRLTWFGTEQMNKLAPLSLSVKPDTSIRVFLDFQGLEKPINLKPQKLTHKPRNGFTLVEWGGLLYK